MPEYPGFGEPLRVLIIGAGKMGRVHARAFTTIPGVEVVGIASRGGKSAASVAEQLELPAYGTDWEAMAEKTRPHACVVAVSHGLNESITEKVIDRGLHVLSEKPVAFTGEGVRKLARLADEKGVIAMAGVNRRYYPSLLEALEVVQYYGGVLGISGMCPDPVQVHRANGTCESFVYDNWTVANTLHVIDTLRFVGGEVVNLTGEGSYHSASGERSIVSSMRFDSGVIGSFTMYAASGGLWEFHIHGDGIDADLDPMEGGILRFVGGETRTLPYSRDPRGIKPGIRPQALGFVEAICDLGKVSYPGSDLHDHAKSVDLATRIAQIGFNETAA